MICLEHTNVKSSAQLTITLVHTNDMSNAHWY